MSGSEETLELARCGSCQSRFLPNDGPCPHCGSTDCHLFLAPAIGKVLAATELVHPAAGWESPHLLAFVEVADGVRLLAIIEGGLPTAGSVVSVRRDREIYRARTEPGVPASAERGEGESPRAGSAGPSFEPPR